MPPPRRAWHERRGRDGLEHGNTTVIQFLVEKHLILRMTGAAGVSFLVVMIFLPRFIRFLLRKNVGDRPEFDHADLNELTRHKSATPTMGGLVIVVAIFVSTLLFADLGNFYIRVAMLALIWLAGLGAVDDWLKLRSSASGGTTRDGLKAWEKILFQIGLGVLLAVFAPSLRKMPRQYQNRLPISTG